MTHSPSSLQKLSGKNHWIFPRNLHRHVALAALLTPSLFFCTIRKFIQMHALRNTHFLRSCTVYKKETVLCFEFRRAGYKSQLKLFSAFRYKSGYVGITKTSVQLLGLVLRECLSGHHMQPHPQETFVTRGHLATSSFSLSLPSLLPLFFICFVKHTGDAMARRTSSTNLSPPADAICKIPQLLLILAF